MGSKSTFTFVGVDQVTPELQKINKSITTFEKNVKQISTSIKGMLPAIGLGMLAAQATEFAKESVRAFAAYEQGLLKLKAQLPNDELGTTYQRLKDIATQLNRTSGTSTDEVLNNIAILKSFGIESTDTLAQVLTLSSDIGSVYGNMGEAVKKLGKALEAPVAGMSALAEVGILFTESEKQHITNLVNQNRLEEAQVAILDKVRERYASIAITINSGVQGSLNKFSSAWDETMRNMGSSISKWAQPAIDKLTTQIDELNAKTTQSSVTTNQWNSIGKLDSLYSQYYGRGTTDDARQKLNPQVAQVASDLSASGYDFFSQIRASETLRKQDEAELERISKFNSQAYINWANNLRQNIATRKKQEEELTRLLGLINNVKQVTTPVPPVTPVTGNTPGTDNVWNQELALAGAQGKADYAIRQQQLADEVQARIDAEKQLEESKSWEIQVQQAIDDANRQSVENQKAYDDYLTQQKLDNIEKIKLAQENAVQTTFLAYGELSKVFGQLNDLQQQYSQIGIESIQSDLTEYETSQNAKIESAKASGQSTAQLEQDKANKVYALTKKIGDAERKAKREAWEANKAASVANIIMGTAEGVVNALKIAPPFGEIQAGIVGTSGLAQLAIAMSQPTPKFATGGIVPGASYSGDRVPVLANSGEMFLNPVEQANLFNLIASGRGSGQTIINNYIIETAYGTVDKDFVQALWKTEAKLAKERRTA